MSIYIKGMEMPTDGPLIFKINPDGTVSTTWKNGYKKYTAVPVPPHGRLIDADALMLKIQEYIEEYGEDVYDRGWHNLKWCAMKEVEMAINDAETVFNSTR